MPESDTDTAGQGPARPPMFAAPMDDARKRFLLQHLPRLSSVEELPAGEIKQLGQEGLVWLIEGRLMLTEKGRELLKVL
jgi:hypothetical protein